MEMKKIIVSLSFIVASTLIQAQEITPNDGLRYSMESLTGSARFRGMSGAFGALGGDLSAIGINPAGSVIFIHNQATLSISSFNNRNKSSYFDTKTVETDNSLDFNQMGAVFVFTNQNPDSNWRKMSLAVNYENNNNFDNQLHTKGFNTNNSIDQYFLRFANGLPSEGGIFLDVLDNSYFDELSFIDQQAYLGYQGFIFNPLVNEPTNTLYVSNVPAGPYYHENITTTDGYNGKLTGNFATSYKDRIFLGVNINAHFSEFTNLQTMFESYANSANTGIRSVQFDTETYTMGSGISFGLGAIGKITDDLRVGIAYESPTWYRFNDEQHQRIITYCTDCATSNPIVIDPGVTMIYEDYKIQTPSKWTGSIAYTFNKKGLLSFDYTLKDYSEVRFKPKNNSYYASLNEYANTNFDTAMEYRIGGEYKIKDWSLRGGYRFEESPYKNDVAIGDLKGYSAGLGYNFGESRLDIAYNYERRKFNQALLSSGLMDSSRITAINNNVTLSYSINF